jgi:D-beta-D-heptose 7-phosphate kinase/D-beta-D-heptose 1-phosphate adenosyltransferase
MKPNILVVGDLIMDYYLLGNVNRISPEAPIPIVEIQKEKISLGGAGNVVNNLLKLGSNVCIASVVGDDENGKWILERLKRKNIDINSIILEKDRRTSKKTRVLSSNQQIVRFDIESKDDISKESEEKILSEISKNFNYDLILLSDYSKGVLTQTLCQSIIKLANLKSICVFIDPKGVNYNKYRGASLITPNKKEAHLATKIDIIDDETLQKAGLKLKFDYEINNVIITLGKEGMAIIDKKMMKIQTVAKEIFDVTGAGDTVLASLGYSIAKGMNFIDAAIFANFAAGVVVGKVGCATASLMEIEEHKNSLNKNCAENLIKTFDEIEEIAIFTRKRNKKIVFTNGCFDILHLGHVKYLEEGKKLGDILIVGINSDESLSRLKGKNRPINSEYDRAYILAALECVDYVVIFNQDTPYKLIKKIQPNTLIKGADYRNKEIIGSNIVKDVRLINFIEGKSTSKLIEKLQEQ